MHRLAALRGGDIDNKEISASLMSRIWKALADAERSSRPTAVRRR
jgi:hypothetical protein